MEVERKDRLETFTTPAANCHVEFVLSEQEIIDLFPPAVGVTGQSGFLPGIKHEN